MGCWDLVLGVRWRCESGARGESESAPVCATAAQNEVEGEDVVKQKPCTDAEDVGAAQFRAWLSADASKTRGWN
jgi:hypothetical protein